MVINNDEHYLRIYIYQEVVENNQLNYTDIFLKIISI